MTPAGSAAVRPERPAVLAGSMARRLAARALTGLAVLLLMFFVLGPLVWLTLWAFAGPWTYPSLTPQGWTLNWWRLVFSTPGLERSIELSFLFAPVVTGASALICLPAAYAFGRLSFPGRRLLLVSLFATNAFPKIGLYITMAGLFFSLHLMSTFLGVVLVQLIGTVVFMTWIPAAAFASVPRSLEEAARDVGAGRLRTFWRVTMPLALPGILVAVILSFLAAFDEAQGTFLVGTPHLHHHAHPDVLAGAELSPAGGGRVLDPALRALGPAHAAGAPSRHGRPPGRGLPAQVGGGTCPV